MTELHGRLIGFLDVISLEAFASDLPRGAAGRPLEDRRGLVRAFGLALRKWQSHPLLWIGEVAMSRNKPKRFTDEFKREAVWLIETSGRKVQHIPNDLGFAKSKLSRWRSKHDQDDLLEGQHSPRSSRAAQGV